MVEVSQAREVWTPRSVCRYTEHRIGRADRRNRRSLRAFAEWLSSSRGLSDSTIEVRIHSACTFVDSLTSRKGFSCARAFRRVTVDEIEDFFVSHSRVCGRQALRSMQSAMRLFLRFAWDRGWIERSLIGAVPSMVSYRLRNPPQGLSDDQLSKLFESRWKDGLCPRRDWAIACLLATYGVRRGQVSALGLSDIDWHEKTVDFAAHKGGKSVRQPLTDTVAEALSEYLSQERPKADSRSVFLRHRPPHVRLSPGAISVMVSTRMRRQGLPPRHPHAFRHTFATRLLRAGQPVKVIADLLGHRSLSAVAIYAKVDYSRLLQVAGEWPEAMS